MVAIEIPICQSSLMSYEYFIDKSVNIVFVRHLGQMALDDVLNEFGEFMNDPNYQTNLNILRDTRDATFPPEWNFEFFRDKSPKRFDEIWARLGTCKIAWVTRSGADFRIAHQASITSRFSGLPIKRHIFTEIEKARSWLAIPEDHKIKISE